MQEATRRQLCGSAGGVPLRLLTKRALYTLIVDGAGAPRAKASRGYKYEKHPPPLTSEDSCSNGAQAKKPGFLARQVARARLLLKLDIPLFFRLNFLCPQVRRQKGKYIFPYRGTRLRLARTARINVRGHVFLNKGKYPHSRQECELALADGAVWDVNGEFWLNRMVSVGVGKNAHLTTGQAIHPNVGSSIGCGKKITIGNHVAIGPMVYIFDSDSHPRYDSEGRRANADKEVIIEDNVWIGTKSTILKGTRIGTGAVIAANSLVSGYVPPHTMVASTPARPFLKNIGWER